MSIIDRYVIRQVLLPFCIALLTFTFLLILPLLIEYAEIFIAKGVPALVVFRLMLTLVPYGLSLTIPMSLLVGLLVAFGRLSADREFVAMQACGVSLMRLLRPVGAVSLLCWAATSYVLFVAQPWGNRTFVERRNAILAERAEGEVKAHAFTSFPDVTLYVREVPAEGGGWNGVFMHDSRPGQPASVYLAQRGHVFINREKKTVEMVMEDGIQHTADANGEYKVLRFASVVLTLDPEKFLPRLGSAMLGANEMTIPELREKIAELEKNGISAHTQRIAIQHKFAIPIACLVFAVMGLALGATHRRDGSLGSFVIGLAVVFLYYIPLYLGPQMAKGGLVPPWFAAWLPNIVIGSLAAALFMWRDRVADRAITLSLPKFLRRSERRRAHAVHLRSGSSAPMLSLLDRYVATMYLRILGVSAAAMLGIFYISTFIDISDKIFKGMATWGMLVRFFYYSTPQYIYFVIPLSVLLSALITIGALTKNSELIVMKACGISLYRVALPMLACAIAAAALLFALEQTILGNANRRAAEIRYVMNGQDPQTFNVLFRQWISGPQGEIYHYLQFDPKRREMARLEVFEFTDGMRRLVRRTSADRAEAVGGLSGDTWKLTNGWAREFDEKGQPAPPPNGYKPFKEQQVRLQPPEYFGTEEPEPKFMTFTQLRGYISQLELTGFDVTEQHVALARKLAFPFVTLVMTLIAVPFGVTTGRGGAMAGIGVGIALAITYWTAISVFAALGAGAVLPAQLAAWAPNMLFGAAAAYLLLTVRT